HGITLLHHAIAMEYDLFPLTLIGFSKVEQRRYVRKCPALRGFSTGYFHLPFSSAPVQIFPAYHVSINGAKLIIEWNGIMIVDKDKAIANRQLLEKLYQCFMPFDRNEHPHIKLP